MNVQVITQLFEEDDFYFMMINSEYSPDQVLSAIWRFPAFCGEVPAESEESIFEICKREMTLWITYILRSEKIEDECNDLTDEECYDDSEFIQLLGRTRGNTDCIDTGSCTAADYFDDSVDTAYVNADGLFYGRGVGPEPLVGNEDYA